MGERKGEIGFNFMTCFGIKVMASIPRRWKLYSSDLHDESDSWKAVRFFPRVCQQRDVQSDVVFLFQL